jgi:predicted esterase
MRADSNPCFDCRQAMPAFATIFLTALLTLSAAAADFGGEWRTSFGVVTLKQAGDHVAGTYGDAGQFTLDGTVAGNKLSFDYTEGQAHGSGQWTLDKSGLSFGGTFQVQGGRAGEWQGWRPDPKAIDAPRADVSGLWLTDLGLMELSQSGEQVVGRFALRGGSDIEGTVTGRHFEFTFKAFRPGKGWFDFGEGKASDFAGANVTDGFAAWSGWRGRRTAEFLRHAKLQPGKVVDGSTKGLLTYTVRAPERYRAGDGKKWPCVVILHGSNMNARAYVETIVAAWPDVAQDYVVLGINGERPSSLGDGAKTQPAFNFSYVNYVGKSTFKGFPGTDRESPALVAEALTELREVYPISKYFVGGHSQGGFLTYSLLMNSPELFAGAFPVSSGVIFQTEPGAYADEKLKAAQRAVPLAIVHSKQDNVVNFSMGEYAATLFGEAGWPALRFFNDQSGAGHRFALLPVGEAIRWLEAQSADDPTKLLAFAEQRFKAKGYRDAVAAVNRAAALKPTGAARERLDRLNRQIDAKAAPAARKFLPLVRESKDNAWIDDFLAFRDDFEFAPAAHDVMEAFNALRAKHQEPGRKALEEANVAFREGNRDAGYARYREIVEQHYASAVYRNAKRWLAEAKRAN